MLYYAHSNENKEKSDWHLLKEHLLDTAEMAALFARAFCAEKVAYPVGLLHDAGKYSYEFQLRLEGKRTRVDHSTAGAVEAYKKYGTLGKVLAYIIAGHHCGLPDWGSDADESSLCARLNRELLEYRGFSDEIELPSPRDLTIPSFKPIVGQGFTAQFFIRFLYSCLVDADFIDTERALDKNKYSYRLASYSLKPLMEKLNSYIDDMCANAAETLINRKRMEILTNCREKAKCNPGLFTLTVPTGGGKTLSSLSFALSHALLHEKERVIYVIPYTSIIEQNASVFKEAIGKEYVLEHHSNFSFPHEESEEVENEYAVELRQKISLASENWDMPVVVTTNVQFFESLYASRSSKCRKLHNIANSIIIIDEAQMIHTGFLKPCLSALVELVANYNTTVVLCTATQPAIRRLLPDSVDVVEIIEKPVELYQTFKRVQVRYIGAINDEALEDKLSSCHQVLCIVNSKKHARELFKRTEDNGSYHLSTRMCPVHRTEVIYEIKKRLKDRLPCRVVSTQLIEAGVDIDFPVVYRSMAGIDSIAQAAGRCNREGRLPSGEVFVFWPEEHGMPRGWLKRTASLGGLILERSDDPLGLEGVKEYFTTLFEIDASELDKERILAEIKEQERCINFPFRTVAEKFKLIDNFTSTVIIPWDENCRKLLDDVRFNPNPGLFTRALQKYGVEVFENEFGEMLDYGALEVVANRFYVLRDEVMKTHYKCKTGLEPFTGSMFLNDTLII